MGQGHSELKSSLDKLPSLRNKPELLKAELSQFVDVCPIDDPLPVKLDKKVFDILHELITAEVGATDASPFDLMTVLQALQRFMKIRMFYINLPKADLQPYVSAIRKADPMYTHTTHTPPPYPPTSAATTCTPLTFHSLPLLPPCVHLPPLPPAPSSLL